MRDGKFLIEWTTVQLKSRFRKRKYQCRKGKKGWGYDGEDIYLYSEMDRENRESHHVVKTGIIPIRSSPTGKFRGVSCLGFELGAGQEAISMHVSNLA